MLLGQDPHLHTFPVLESLQQAVLLGFATFLLEAVRLASLGLSRCDSAHCPGQDTQASLLPAARKCAEHIEENPGTFLVEKAKSHLWGEAHRGRLPSTVCIILKFMLMYVGYISTVNFTNPFLFHLI